MAAFSKGSCGFFCIANAHGQILSSGGRDAGLEDVRGLSGSGQVDSGQSQEVVLSFDWSSTTNIEVCSCAVPGLWSSYLTP